MADTTQGQPNGQTNQVVKAGDLATIPINRIRENAVALRPVEKDKEDYQSLVESVRQKGILNPIVVREVNDPEHPGEKLYGLIDGLHRYHAALDAGLKVIPVHIKDMDQAEIEETQIIANVHHIVTKPVQYTKQLERLLIRSPLMTPRELANRLTVSTKWLYDRFNLLKLDEKIQGLVDEGKIKLNNAYQLSKIPKEEQNHWLDRAMTQSPEEFTPAVAARIKEIREARKQGKSASPPTFEPQPHQRKWGEVKEEYNNKKLGVYMRDKHGLTDAVSGWNMAIAWMANMDPESRDIQIAEHDARERAKEEEKKKKDLERQQQRQKEAAERVAALQSNTPGQAAAPAVAGAGAK